MVYLESLNVISIISIYSKVCKRNYFSHTHLARTAHIGINDFNEGGD